MTNQFVHLHIHSEYSIIDGIVRIPTLLHRTSELSMSAAAITDQSNLFGMVKFYKAALTAGIKPIIGTEIWLENLEEATAPFRLVLLCQNEEGYKNLTKLISKAYVENQHLDKAIVKRNWLQKYNGGLLVLSAAIAGDIGQMILVNKIQAAKEYLQEYLALFPNRFYIELQRTGHPHEEDYIYEALDLASKFQVPVVATNNVRFISKDDFEAHEARVCIHGAWLLNDPKRPRNYSEQQYLRSAEEMIELFSDIPGAIENTVEIAKRCNLILSLDKIFLPNFPVPEEGLSLEEYFEKKAKEGLEERLNQCPMSSAQCSRKSYDDRLQQELNVINQIGFAGYFLIVADFIQWAKQNDVPVGPGRGSGAGSLIAYALKITDIDPLKYDLLFERFLNPERISMPDFDIDFCMDGRDRVIDYVAHKYGRESVSQIITYGTMAARAVVRDVGRVLGHGYSYVDKLAKLIPFEIGMTLEKALEQEEVLLERYEQEEEVRNLIDLARKLEGVIRNAGKHAGGVVIAPTVLTDFTPLYCEQGGVNLVTQFDKYDVEAIGLVKFDFLGLRTLTIIDWTVKAINRQQQKKNESPLDISSIPTNDGKTFALLKACKTTAVFQLESRGMKDLIKRLQPDCFEDIIALVALFRPGPLQSGMVDDFINRKHGREKVLYPHEKLIPILKPTYGVILYQEQVMQIAQVLAGYSLGAADLLRRAMGKKKPEEMAKQRQVFIKGAMKNGVNEIKATYIFDLMEKFAGYGFNKSHSAAYALIAYQTAWLKAHYSAEFMASVLSSDMDNTDKMVIFIEEYRAMKLNLLPPNINRSQFKFTVEEGNIVFGLGAIKGAGEAAIESIIAARKDGGNFKDLFDFCRRVDLRKVNRRVLEALIKSGAMDELGAHRAAQLASVDSAIKASEQYSRNTSFGQLDLFGDLLSSEEHLTLRYTKIKPWADSQRLEYENETLGFYLSGHPIEQYEEELSHIVTDKIAKLQSKQNQTAVVVVAGLVVALRKMNTRRGERMAFISLNDRSGRIEVAVFSEIYSKHRDLLEKNALLIIEGEASFDEYSGGYKISATKILTMEQAREVYAKSIMINSLMSDAQCSVPDNQDLVANSQGAGLGTRVDELVKVLSPYRGGNCPVSVSYAKNDVQALLPLGKEWRVKPMDQLLFSLREIFGKDAVRVSY